MLTNKKILVTGGSRGIGLATARMAMARGAQVCITGLDPERLQSAQTALGCLARVCDSRSLESLQNLMVELSNSWGSLDGVVVNAAAIRIAKLSAVTTDVLMAELNANLIGPLFTLQAALPYLSQGSSIVVLSSVAAHAPAPNVPVYGACKAALLSLTQSFARELAPQGIRVNSVSPGGIKTETWGKDWGISEEMARTRQQAIIASTPLGRMGAPHEVASAINFLLSAEASFVTGTDIVVDGGKLLTAL